MAKKYTCDDSRLCCLADTARFVLQFFREERMRGVRHLATERYSTNSDLKKTYVNLIALYKNIVERSLISNNPRVLLSTFDESQRAAVNAAEGWLNQELVRQNFANIMQRVVGDALFWMGIVKVCIAKPEDAAGVGWGLVAGQPYLTIVDPDDFVCDHRARNFDEVCFIGHRYRARLDIVKESEQFNKKARERLEPTQRISYNREGDERIGEIGRDFHGYEEDLYDMVDLWEIYLPHERVVKTFCESDLSGPTSAWENEKPIALAEVDWIGPDTGPYSILAYQTIPGNLMPKGPILDLVNLHEMTNEGYRKLGRQFARLKKYTVCDATHVADLQALKDGKDGDNIPLQNPKAVTELITGGGDAGLFNWVRENIGRFMEQGGNLATMGGLAPQAGTLGQEELLQQQSNGQVAAMQDRTLSFVERCADSMLWYFWHDPRLIMRALHEDPKLPDVHLVRQVYPWTAPATVKGQPLMRRTGEKPILKIDPYSMRHTTPQQRMKDLLGFVTGIYVPLAQMFQSQGHTLDLGELLLIFGKYMDSPDLQRIMKIAAPQEQSVGNSRQDAPGKPPETTRNYNRRSLGNQSSQAQNMEQDNALASQMSDREGGNGKPRQMIHY